MYQFQAPIIAPLSVTSTRIDAASFVVYTILAVYLIYSQENQITDYVILKDIITHLTYFSTGSVYDRAYLETNQLLELMKMLKDRLKEESRSNSIKLTKLKKQLKELMDFKDEEKETEKHKKGERFKLIQDLKNAIIIFLDQNDYSSSESSLFLLALIDNCCLHSQIENHQQLTGIFSHQLHPLLQYQLIWYMEKAE